MIQHRSAILAAVKNLLIAEVFSDPWWRIGPSSALRMATPFPRTMPQVIKIEDEGNHAPYGQASVEQQLMDMFRNTAPPPQVHQQPLQLPPPATSGVSSLISSDQELRNKFLNDVQRLVELRKRLRTSGGSAQPPPPPPPTPIQVQPPPSLLLPPPAHHPWAKRPATAPPPGFRGVRQPPPKQYHRRPPGQRAPAQPQPPPPSARRTPALSARVQTARHAPVPQPTPNACRALVPSAAPPPAQAGHGAAMLPPLKRRYALALPKPPKHPAAKKRPTVPCAFCGVLCMTAWHLKQHEKGRKHRNKVAYLAGEMNVNCPVCDVHLSGALNIEQHYAGKLHAWRAKLSGGEA